MGQKGHLPIGHDDHAIARIPRDCHCPGEIAEGGEDGDFLSKPEAGEAQSLPRDPAELDSGMEVAAENVAGGIGFRVMVEREGA